MTPTMDEVTDELVRVLNDEVLYWQKIALKASENNQQKECQEALEKQAIAVETLIKLSDRWRQK